jgi:hypothetical protein
VKPVTPFRFAQYRTMFFVRGWLLATTSIRRLSSGDTCNETEAATQVHPEHFQARLQTRTQAHTGQGIAQAWTA